MKRKIFDTDFIGSRQQNCEPTETTQKVLKSVETGGRDMYYRHHFSTYSRSIYLEQ